MELVEHTSLEKDASAEEVRYCVRFSVVSNELDSIIIQTQKHSATT